MADTEKLKFEIKLYGEYWEQPPCATILLNNEIVAGTQNITSSIDKPTILGFTKELELGKKYELVIKREGKDKYQTVIENGEIVKDQLLHISSVEIDEIDIGGLIYEGVYTPEYAEPWATQQKEAGIILPKSFKNVTAMGHNGTWSLQFESPFYMWLLENLY